MKLLLLPTFAPVDNGEGGIRRVVEAQRRYLPEFGIDVVDSLEDADVVALHATEWVDTPKPTVLHCHGLYWSEYEWPQGYLGVNRHIIRSMRRADVVTAPSEWVAQSLRRGMWITPVVISHGVSLEDWEPEPSGGYVLWNKTRVDPICDPSPMNRLAALAPRTRFVSTFGQRTDNVTIVGKTDFAAQKRLIARAGVYLCTARETFGIGTLEAMACGVPVLGWDYGGQHDIVTHKESGWLAPVDDYDSLLEGLAYCLKNRDRLGACAIDTVEQRYTWPMIISQYAELYQAVAQPREVTVSVVIPCYNLAQYLPAAIDSALEQPYQDLEVIVIDDASPDNTAEVVRAYRAKDKRVRYMRNKENEYLATALNHGINYAKGKYVIPLDADNMLGPDALTPLVRLLDSTREVDIAYGSMQLLGGEVSSWPPPQMDVQQQLSHHNQCTSTSLYRKRMWEVLGGYRKRCRTAEDADFWCRAAALGFQGARATEAVTLIYRDRADSMSHVEKDWAWHNWYPWAQTCDTMPYGSGQSTPVSHFADPDVSVVIPLGPGHC